MCFEQSISDKYICVRKRPDISMKEIHTYIRSFLYEEFVDTSRYFLLIRSLSAMEDSISGYTFYDPATQRQKTS